MNVETLAWLAVAVVTIATRWINLDGNPLQPSESALAMDSLRILRGLGVTIAPSPFLVYGNVLVFLTLGATDATARALPALSGTLVALSPLLLRRHIGRLGSLAAALILAMSPTLIFGARSVEPTALSLALGLGILVAAIGYKSTGRTSCAYVAGILVPPLLISGPAAVTLVIIMVAYVAISLWSRPTPAITTARSAESIPTAAVENDWQLRALLAELSPATLRRIGLVAIVEYAILATGLGTNLQGLGDSIAQPLAIWAGAVGSINSQSIGLVPLIFFGYEPLILGFGVAGAIRAFRLARPLDQFLAWCAAAAILIVIVGDGLYPLWIELAIAPLGILAGHAVEDLWTAFTTSEQRRRLLVYAAVALPLLATTIIAASNATVIDPAVPRLAFLAPFLAIVFFSLGIGIYYDARTALTSAAAVVFLASCGITVHAAMMLNSGGMLNPADVFVDTATSSDVRTMTKQVTTILGELRIARQLEAKPVIETVSIVSTFANPIEWYLRDFPQARVVSSVGDSPAIAIVGA
ncbi:MAG TPA: hypothetical protein VKT80_15460, partial [Chloroflexota bacterium]|nr:hypothetical protein [Chloroflexota bacterium]